MQTIEFFDFQKVDMRAGTIIEVRDFKEVRNPAYKIWVDMGPLGIKKTSAQITQNYSIEELPGRQVICVCNFPKKQIANFMSEILITGFKDEQNNIVLATLERNVPNGEKLH
ncbi:tRNA-binding protein [Echinicola jeungdonensis]|uniref:tRNA-binding protein n=1 Tax=Echinicola jeungdonensis TaxID=709343 RepID=A0ABV5J6S3_9BACT|nr:tRNA-binding protein [Echinicola jeungdonensis]MDN3669228.1 tRNA-binding protein [Echinicola jeungdonensis]